MSLDRPPAFPSKSSLAQELDCAESTVDELVRRGILPPPIKLTSGCVRWVWDDVVLALTSLKQGTSGDPYMAGVAKLGEESGKKAKGHS
jgi:predicted DNA-binding transcriptional regulator AlpA